ncbi:hypothetical protein EJ05DRAFT_483569 [Pseudovirgaria hyperparasitica]|uniref:GPI inositol-deacylase n=1 Tax=Pseudovirgaria hyperparasitica TaxID=470096 RepID=A0A6A6WGH5_9PEZI|nr:uncharacterized protein EJ05DRAFT_483569 [Pseudovirgaria hyperparasitica]KAF2761174.1 hypothetical protein EJ05DRAFT_483569 [Pseudovirgaria hyperparasitica]
MNSLWRRSTSNSQRKPGVESINESIDLSTDEAKGPLGLHLLSAVPTPLIDLIFVHGLGGGSRKTWSKSSSNFHFWPKEWLPNDPDFENVRIHSFGYKADWSERRESILNIQDFAHSLLGEVQDSPHIRRSRTKIILVGHSMGGIVIKKAYVVARQKALYSEFASRVRAIHFLATPHRGSDMARTLRNILRLVSGSKPFVDELDPSSSSISTINETFRQYAEDLHLRSFFESQPSKIGLASALIVDKDSATLGFAGERFECIYADHRGVCKFDSADDSNYKIVRNALSATVDAVVSEEYSNNTNPSEQKLDGLKILTAIPDLPEDDLMVLDENRALGSCKWFSDDVVFDSWRNFSRKSPPFLWLSGNAASGKSVLASHVIHELRGDGSSCSYFFFKDGVTGRSTVSDCLRSLALQMAFIDSISRNKMMELQKEDVSWDREDERAVWRKLFQRCLFPLEGSQFHHWVIDGLDECSNSHALFSLLGRPPPNLRILITSRRIPEIEHAFGTMKGSVVQRQISAADTARDVKIYLDSMMDQLPVGYGDTRAWLEEQLLTKANGSFLWVRLIVRELKTTYSEEAIESVLNEVPPDMNDVYARMLRNILKSNRNTKLARAILTWCVCAIRPLTVQELQYALKLDIKETVHGLEQSIASICGHLVFIDHASRVQMVHQTAKEFMIAQNCIPELQIDRKVSHAYLASICARFLSSDWFREQKILNGRPPFVARRSFSNTKPFKPDNPASKSAFEGYVCSFFSDHIYRSTSVHPGPLEELCLFFKGNVFSWIEYAARSKDLGILIRAAKNLGAFLERRAKHYPPVSREVETVQLWATDLIRVSAKFRSQLLASPSSIHSLIPPICPSDSIIARMYSARQRGLLVKGLYQKSWDDCLARIDFQGAQTTAVTYGERLFAIGLSKGAVKLYDGGSFQLTKTLCHAERVKLVQFANDERWLLTIGLRHACLWDTDTGENLWKHGVTHPIMSAMFTIDDELLLVACRDNTLRTLRVGDGIEINVINLVGSIDSSDLEQFPSQSPSLAVFSDDYTSLAVSYRGKTVLLLDVDNERLPLSFIRAGSLGDYTRSTSQYGVDAIAFNPSPEINVLIVSYGDGELVVYDLWTAEPRDQIPSVAHKARCKCLILGVSAGDRLSMIYRIDAYEHGIRALAFSQDSLRFMDIRSTQCRLWEPAILVRKDVDGGSSSEFSLPVPSTARRGSILEGLNAPEITAMKMTADGLVAFLGKEDGTVSWLSTNDASTGGVLYSHAVNVAVTALAITETDGLHISSADESGRLLVAQVSKKETSWALQEMLGDIKTNESTTGIQFEPSTKNILAVGQSVYRAWSPDGTKLYEMSAIPGSAIAQLPTDPRTILVMNSQEASLNPWDNSTPTTIKLDRVLVTADSVPISLVISPYIAADLRLSKNDTRTLTCWPTPSFTNTASLLTASPGFEHIGAKIDHLIAAVDHILYFLDTDLWVCSLDTRSFGATQQYKRHFFVLSEWRNMAGKLLILLCKRDFAIARKGDLVVIRRGLDFAEVKSVGAGRDPVVPLADKMTPLGLESK